MLNPATEKALRHKLSGIGDANLLASARPYVIPRSVGNSVPNIIVFTPTQMASPWAKQYDWFIGVVAPYNPAIVIAILGEKSATGKVDHWITLPTGGALINANTLTQSIQGMSVYTVRANAPAWLKNYEWVIGAPVSATNVLAIFGSLRNHKFVDWTKRADHGVTIAGNTLYGFVPAR